jgi:uncharacterized damage-inducible protein DinB
MTLAEMFLKDLDWEAPTTRKTLERVPDGRAGWQPHPKSTMLGYLASHLAQLPKWITMTVQDPGLDMRPKDGASYVVPTIATTKGLLDAFDGLLVEAKGALADATDAQLLEPWTLRAGDHVILEQPRYVILRNMVLNHMVHHRAQLGVYLRLNDIPVPASYGPSAEEMPSYAPPDFKRAGAR